MVQDPATARRAARCRSGASPPAPADVRRCRCAEIAALLGALRRRGAEARDGVTPMTASILLVDDQPENLLALEALLEPLGRPLMRALSGDEALQAAARARTSR